MLNKQHMPRGRLLRIGVVMISLVIIGSTLEVPWKAIIYDSPKRTNSTSVYWGPGTNDVSLQQKLITVRAKGNYTLKKVKRFPEGIIIGAKKCGTGALAFYLDMHPNIRASGESHFFSLDSKYSRGLDHYRNLMPETYPYEITIDRTPRYWVSERAAKRIHQFNKNIKLIVSFRHPVKRMISDYWYVKRQRHKNNRDRYNEIIPDASATFEELAIDKITGEVNTSYQAVNVSMYYMHLTRWFKYFPREQIHIVDGDNLIVNPIEEIEKIETFLGLEHRVTKDNIYFDSSKGFYCMLKAREPVCLPDLKGSIHPAVDPIVYQKLMDFFQPLNEHLFSLLGRSFNWD